MKSFKMTISHFSVSAPARVAKSYGYESGSIRNKLWLAELFLMLIMPVGCQYHKVSESSQACSYLNPDRNLISIGRVAFVELDNDSAFPKISVTASESLFLAMQKKQIFGLTLLSKDAAAWRSLGIKQDAGYTLEELFSIREALKCNALLVGNVTQYEPYPHMVIGLRLRLLDLNSGQLLWAIEQVWDSADKTVEKRIKNYFRSQIPWSTESLHEQMTVVSPLEFIRFVAYETAETLQIRGNKNANIGFSEGSL